ncbi:MAG: hypothetical protein C7B44_13055 [Sulfobacillus thermosulfidooxidans]|uniref:Uncharacterized protein n=1 Tax=Sulfobacillus thermotolerans TaxID=338644 RepID=A0ABN5H0F1_9FIRM|nr:hypothetical protein BXT84_08815 [Sulfobacillus thermotolerans]MCY0907957.1 hypothetical protein [Sulfobacillus thermotolerans]PSR35653.1 MAG: hypothetical protein C7B44_13055 [Sulfobacillus thermosulfidooxidans]
MAPSSSSIVSRPLSKNPPLIWGMTVKDLMWPVLSLALDAIIWRHDPRGGFVEVLVLTACAALGMALGIVRVHGRSIPSWLLVILLFYLHPRLYLP